MNEIIVLFNRFLFSQVYIQLTAVIIIFVAVFIFTTAFSARHIKKECELNVKRSPVYDGEMSDTDSAD